MNRLRQPDNQGLRMVGKWGDGTAIHDSGSPFCLMAL
ncbi:hypothetical protein QFZ94_003745 [Paraburkholderia sp. JPY465]